MRQSMGVANSQTRLSDWTELISLGGQLRPHQETVRRPQRMRWLVGNHTRNGHEFEQTLGGSDGQGSLACCSPCGHKELDTTELLNNIVGSSLPDQGWKHSPPYTGRWSQPLDQQASPQGLFPTNLDTSLKSDWRKQLHLHCWGRCALRDPSF